MKHFPAILKGMLTTFCAATVLSGLAAIPAATGNRFGQVTQKPKNILKSPSEPKGHIEVAVAMWQGMMSHGDAFWGEIDLWTGKFKKEFTGSQFGQGDNYDFMTGAVRNDILYTPEIYYDEIGMIDQTPSFRWRRTDLKTGKPLSSIEFGRGLDNSSMYLYAMTYDEINDIIYGLHVNPETWAGGDVVKIDCSKPESQWKAEFLGNVGGTQSDWMAAIAFNPMDEKLYGLNKKGEFCEIDTDDGEAKKVVLFQYDDFMEEFCYLTSDYSAQMVYSPYDNAMFFNNVMNGFRICAIDMSSYEAIEVCYTDPSAYIGTLYCADPYADENAPDRMATPEVTFTEANLTGSYTVTLPSTLFSGEPISGEMKLHVNVDGNEIYVGVQQPGAEYKSALTLPQGYHTMTVFASIDDLQGPKRSVSFTVGYDQPKAPTALKLANGKLSWTAPADGGVNGGYTDFATSLTYNVFINGNKINTDPITGDSYQIDYNAYNGTCDIQVQAVSHNVESDLSDALVRVLGKGATLPVTYAPTAEEAELFQTLNVGNDKWAFAYDATSKDYPMFEVHTGQYSDMPNDWLFLPPVYCDDVDALYALTVKYHNYYLNADHYDNLDICIGNDPQPESMTNVIYTHEGRAQNFATDIKARFTVEKPGTYYIGIHSKPGDITKYRGISLSNFRLTKDQGNTNAPGAPTDVTVEGAPRGDLSYNVKATLPTVGLNGKTLDPNTVITLTANSGSDEASASGKPGETVEFEVLAASDGFSYIILTPSSDDGEGAGVYYKRYAGFDTPLPPTNLKYTISEDNLSMTITWDPVPAKGLNGGYIDTESVTYDIYNQSSSNSTTRIGTSGKETTYVFKTAPGRQATFNIIPVAVTSKGTSINGSYVREQLGTLYDAPVHEEWGNTSFNYYQWTWNTTSEFGLEWTHCVDGTGIGIGDPTFADGGGMYATGNGYGELIAPKLSTGHIDSAKLALTYWDYEKAGAIEVWGRSFVNQEYRKIGEFTPARGEGSWEEWELNLPSDFANQPWIQVNIRTRLRGGESVLLENYQILQNAEYDFQLSSISAPYSTFVGESPKFNVVVTNSGDERNSGTLKVELLGEGFPIQTQTVEMGQIRGGETFEYPAVFDMIEDYIKYNYMEVRASVTSPNDMNGRNNEKTVEFILNDHSMPIVRDLKAERADNGQDVNLTWSTPDATIKDLESFEVNASFTIDEKIGRWGNFDFDGKEQFALQNAHWNNDDKPSAWQVFDAKSMGTMNDSRLCPHSGERMIIARSVAYDMDSGQTPTQSFDFLVSPEIVGGSTVDFWMNTLNSQYTETVQIWYSSTDATLNADDLLEGEPSSDGNYVIPRKCGSFKWLANFTKSGSDAWEHLSQKLPDDAKYFAFVYNSFGQLGATLDDITFEPVEKGTIDIDSYDLYVAYGNDEPTLAFSGIKSTDKAYTHTPGNTYAATYYLKTVAKDGDEYFESAISNPAFVDGTGVDEISGSGSFFIGGGKGRVLVGGAEGQEFSLFDLNGRLVAKTLINSDRQAVICPAGVYVGRIGKTAVKVIVR